MRTGWRAWLVAGVSALALAGCSGVLTTVGELRDVQAAVKRAVPCEEVRVKLWNGKRLEVQLVHLKPAPEGEAARKGKALEVARQAYERYGQKGKITGVTVSIVERKRYLLLLKVDQSEQYAFSAAELKTPTAVWEARQMRGH